MKYTLLEMVQDVLSSMDGDEVNSISDTVEATQVAKVIRACYFDIVSDNLPEHTTLYQLTASGDNTKPVLMTRPSDVHSLVLLKYDMADAVNTDPRFEMVRPLAINDFFQLTHGLSLSEDNVESMSHDIDGTTFTFLYENDKAPSYYTTVDDHTFFFNSYDSEVDTTLQQSKTFCVGEKEQTFELLDAYEIALDEGQHVWLLNEAKALAFAELKQLTHEKAEKTARRHRIKAMKQKAVMNDPWMLYNKLPSYGRRTPMTSNIKLH